MITAHEILTDITYHPNTPQTAQVNPLEPSETYYELVIDNRRVVLWDLYDDGRFGNRGQHWGWGCHLYKWHTEDNKWQVDAANPLGDLRAFRVSEELHLGTHLISWLRQQH